MHQNKQFVKEMRIKNKVKTKKYIKNKEIYKGNQNNKIQNQKMNCCPRKNNYIEIYKNCNHRKQKFIKFKHYRWIS